MCGGFTCTKNALTALNLIYILVSIILISVAAYGMAASKVTSISIIGGIIACGVFLLLLSLLGLVGVRSHHQVMLFFYMVVLFILFVVQFSIACACLAFSSQQQSQLAQKGWNTASKRIQQKAQVFYDCCGYETNNTINLILDRDCPNVKCCQDIDNCQNSCHPCAPQIKKAIKNALEISGYVGLFFSFTEFIGVWLTVRYRNQKNPRADPSAFL
ncbi:tetraspanin-13-like [Oppia nitens]|uniref:tetraspanin-13-like n=1 Tax=Oppia nitens TaxID=1686743 RepID=UPI0023DC8F90|nr:tetraspanin-13-like [Oppia nitens]